MGKSRVAPAICTLAGNIGKGIFAGLAGTAAMTLAQTIEMRVSGRKPSLIPVKVAEKVLKIKAVDEQHALQVSNTIHWMYGTGWGVFRGLMGTVGIKGTCASTLHFAGMWGLAAKMFPKLKIAPPPQQWSRSVLAKDIMFHAVYAIVAGVVYDITEPKSKRNI